MKRNLKDLLKLEKENDSLKVEIALRNRKELILKLMREVPEHARSKNLMDRMWDAPDEESMRLIAEDQAYAANVGVGKVTDSGEEYDPNSTKDTKETTEGAKEQVIGAIRKGGLKIISGGRK